MNFGGIQFISGEWRSLPFVLKKINLARMVSIIILLNPRNLIIPHTLSDGLPSSSPSKIEYYVVISGPQLNFFFQMIDTDE